MNHRKERREKEKTNFKPLPPPLLYAKWPPYKIQHQWGATYPVAHRPSRFIQGTRPLALHLTKHLLIIHNFISFPLSQTSFMQSCTLFIHLLLGLSTLLLLQWSLTWVWSIPGVWWGSLRGSAEVCVCVNLVHSTRWFMTSCSSWASLAQSSPQ